MRKIRQIKVISFDFGGTLAYETTEDSIIFRQILEEFGYKFDIDEVKSALDFSREWWRTTKEDKIWNEKEMLNFHRKVLSKLKIPNPEELAEKTSKILPQRLDFKPYKDTKPTLENLKMKGYPLVIISNVSSKRNLETYLRKATLIDYFDELFASGSIGIEKPNPQIFRKAAEVMKTSCQAIIHIGNSYENDYLGAKSAGMKAILIDRNGKYKDKECKRISNLTQLLELLTIK